MHKFTNNNKAIHGSKLTGVKLDFNKSPILIFHREKAIAVESSVAKCLETLSRTVSSNKKEQNQHKDSIVHQSVLFTLPSGHVNLFSLTLRRILCSNGLQTFLSHELKVVTIKVGSQYISTCFEYVPTQWTVFFMCPDWLLKLKIIFAIHLPALSWILHGTFLPIGQT